MKKGRFWLTTICILLAAALLLPGCTAKQPEETTEGQSQTTQIPRPQWRWEPIYNNGTAFNIDIAAPEIPGLYWEELSLEKLAALTPSVKMDWMRIGGKSYHYPNGTLCYVALDIITRANVVHLYMGKYHPGVRYEYDKADVSWCRNVPYRLYEQQTAEDESRLEATVTLNNVPMHFVMYSVREEEVEEFELVLQCFNLYTEGKPYLPDAVSLPEETTQETDWTPLYIPVCPHDNAAVGGPYTPVYRYEELRPENYAQIMPLQRPYWMKAQGYTAHHDHEFYDAHFSMELSTSLPGYQIQFSASVITPEAFDEVLETAKQKKEMDKEKGKEDKSITFCHGAELHFYEYGEENVVLEASGRIRDRGCTFTMSVPKGDEELLRRAKMDFEQVVESFCLSGKAEEQNWHRWTYPRYSDEYERKDISYGDAYHDRIFGEYVKAIGHNPELKMDTITRDAFYGSDELTITYTSPEDTFEWLFRRTYNYQTQPIKPGQEIEFRTPVYAAEDVTEELLRSRFQEHPETGVGIQFENMLLWVDNSEPYVSWIYEQIVRMHEQTKDS